MSFCASGAMVIRVVVRYRDGAVNERCERAERAMDRKSIVSLRKKKLDEHLQSIRCW